MAKAKATMALAKTKKRPVNPCAKQRPVDDPYEVWENRAARFTVKVLKKSQSPENEALNPLSTWIVFVKSPFNGDGQIESAYAADIKRDMVRIK